MPHHNNSTQGTGCSTYLPTYLPIAIVCNIVDTDFPCGLAGTVISKLALPALVVHSLVTLDLSSVNWLFLLAVAVAKTALFGLAVQHPQPAVSSFLLTQQ